MKLGDQFYRVAPATPLEGGAFAVPDVVIDLAAREKALRTTDLDDATARLMGHDRETGRRPVGVSPHSFDACTEQEKREKEHQAVLVQVILEQQLREMLDDLYQERERLYGQLTEIQEERQRLVEQIESHDFAIDRLDALGTRIAREGLPRRLRNGRFDDTELEVVLRVYEDRTGKAVDRSDLSDVQRVIAIETLREKERRADVQDRIADLDDQVRDVTDGIQDVEDRIDDVTRALEGTDAPDFEKSAQAVLTAGDVEAVALAGVAPGDDALTVTEESEAKASPNRGFSFGGGR